MVKLQTLKTVCATLISFFNKTQLIYNKSRATYSPATFTRIIERVVSSATETKKMKMALI